MTPELRRLQREAKRAKNPLPDGPFGIKTCRKCWNALDDLTAYCNRCGHVSTCFLGGAAAGSCFSHSERRAEHLCNYCVRPFCMDCLKVNPDTSLCLGTSSYYCHLCLKAIADLKRGLETRDKKYCFRHPQLLTSEKCGHCGEATCDNCTFYQVLGFFRPRISSSPLCFNCVLGRVGYRISRSIVKCNVQKPHWNEYIFKIF